jgi:ribonuclease HI
MEVNTMDKYYNLNVICSDVNDYFKYNNKGLSIKKNTLKRQTDKYFTYTTLINKKQYDEIVCENKNIFRFINKKEVKNSNIIKIYSDGAVFNQGKSLKKLVGTLSFASYSFIIMYNDNEIYRSSNLIKGDFDSNQIELFSVCQALNTLKSLFNKDYLKNKNIIINTDSKVVLEFISNITNCYNVIEKCSNVVNNNFYSKNMKNFLIIMTKHMNDKNLNFYVNWIKSHQDGCSYFNKESIYNNLVDSLCTKTINDELKRLHIDYLFKKRFNKEINIFVEELL